MLSTLTDNSGKWRVVSRRDGHIRTTVKHVDHKQVYVCKERSLLRVDESSGDD